MAGKQEGYSRGNGRKGQAGGAGEGPGLYSVGEVCSMAGTTRKTLFYYDKIGLLAPTVREGPQNFKQYDVAKLRRLQRILRYREAGLTIAEIRELLDDREADHLKVLRHALERLLSEEALAGEQVRRLQELIEEEKSG